MRSRRRAWRSRPDPSRSLPTPGYSSRCNHGYTTPMTGQMGTWVLLGYRLPREPSTPRITVWRKLKRLGVVQLSDGMVALPADARTREHLEWIAEEVTEAGGDASIWLSQPATHGQERELAR